MKKVRNIIIILVVLIAIVAVVFVIRKGNVESFGDVPGNYEYKISIDYDSTPLIIVSYYFYDNMVIKEHYSGGVLASGPSTSSEITKYEYKSSTNLEDLLKNVEDQIYGVSVKKSDKTKTLTSVDYFGLAAIEDNIDSVINKLATEK